MGNLSPLNTKTPHWRQLQGLLQSEEKQLPSCWISENQAGAIGLSKPGFVGFALTPTVETLNTLFHQPYLCRPSDCGGTVWIFRWVTQAGFGLLVMGFVLRD